MKTFLYILIAPVLLLGGCNSVYLKNGSLDKNAVIYADRGGYSLKRSIKEEMENRGYRVVVGKANASKSMTSDSDDGEIDIDYANTMNARYVVKVKERREKFAPVWCIFNGFWWWNFNVSIADQATGQEILSWRGRGCANSSVRKLENVLDKLEIQ